MAAFKLSKWYLDCVTSSGDVSIVYTGTAGWGPARVHYSSFLESTGSTVGVRQALRQVDEPTMQDGCLGWHCDLLGVAGKWSANGSELRETIFESEDGAVEWRCVMPRARVQIGNRAGLGYVEHLNMTIAPWRIPISTLRWGRFLNESYSMVWIDWCGAHSRRVAYLNGQAVTAGPISDAEVMLDHGSRLCMMGNPLTLRDGPIGSTALAAIPGIRNTFPARLLQIRETKWRSSARLELADGSYVEGWAIHERVDWPEP